VKRTINTWSEKNLKLNVYKQLE